MRNFTIISNLLSHEELNSLLHEFSLSEFSKSESNTLLSVSNPVKGTLAFSILRKIKEQIYKEIQNSYSCEITKDVGLAVLKYEKNCFIDRHRDWEPNDPYVVKFNKPRVDLGCIIYVNDDYVGGEILFFNDKDSEVPFMSIKPNFGTCLLFDSSIYHKTNPIVSGIKYSVTEFLQIEKV
jgi:predicted 2-oxoglutarate/Fe(II)-dependent dioxygenase YbiX